jgi:catechol 2,3-dioxygenase-like lactoylglutathione lyase family enzyme
MEHIIDHVGINAKDYDRAKSFYQKALAPLGIGLVMEYPPWCGFGKGQKAEFWIGSGTAAFQRDEQVRIITPVHVCFAASSRAEVDAFYAAAIAAGGKDNGPPGVRAQYHPNYYGAFVIDPDGHNVEAVFHGST